MSTTIYYAWKVEINKLNEFIDFVRQRVLNHFKTVVLELMPQITQEDINQQREQHPYYHNDEELRLECLFDIYRMNSNGNMTSTLNIWLHENYAYIIPVGYYKWFDVPPNTEEFRYWNNTDRPKELSEEEWDFRRETWNNINCGEGVTSHNSRRLQHTIIDMAGIGDIDFELMMHEAIKDNNNVNSS